MKHDPPEKSGAFGPATGTAARQSARSRRPAPWLVPWALAAAAGFILFVAVPQVVQDRLNPVSGQTGSVKATTVTLHNALTVADLHADALLWDRDLQRRNAYGHVDIPRLQAGNVALQAFALVTKVPRGQNYESNDSTTDRITLAAVLQLWPVATWRSPFRRALHQAGRLDRAAAASDGGLVVLRTRSDLEALIEMRAAGRPVVGGFLGIEGAHALEGQLSNLDSLYEAGVRMVGLAHFHDNRAAGSAHGAVRGGLTDLGRQVVRRSEDLGMVVDLAHASGATMDDALEVGRRPVVVSHTGVQATCAGRRNLSDRQIDEIAAAGGVIGIGFWPEAVCGSDASDIARAILYVAERVGPEHVALGSDFDGAVRVPFDASGMHWVTQALRDAGMDDSDVALVMGQNVVRLLLATLPVT